MHSGFWHCPTFEQSLCGSESDRERLGLPDRYTVGRFDDIYAETYGALRTNSLAGLTALCEDQSAKLVERLTAGNIIALQDDSRIDTFDPTMISYSGSVAPIGLGVDEVDRVLRDMSGLALKRDWILKECPRHFRNIAPFSIAKYPVTNHEYREFLKDSGYWEIPTSWSFRRFPRERANHPVYTVSAGAADAYCAWLSERTGKSYRLPSEAEWEYAAAGAGGREFPWGNSFQADCANTAETGLFGTTPVGIFTEGNTPEGVADLAGNVEEYVADSYQAYPGGETITDHLSANSPAYRVARGGSFARFRDLARTRRRHGHNPRSAVYAMGFRLALS